MKKIIIKTKNYTIFLSFSIAILSCTPLFSTIKTEYTSSTTTNTEIAGSELPTPPTMSGRELACEITHKAGKIIANILLFSGGMSLMENFLDLIDEIDEHDLLTKGDLFTYGLRGLAAGYVIYHSLQNLYQEIESCAVFNDYIYARPTNHTSAIDSVSYLP